MSKELVISAGSHERRVAILEEGQLVEIYIEREKEFALSAASTREESRAFCRACNPHSWISAWMATRFCMSATFSKTSRTTITVSLRKMRPPPALAAQGGPAIEVLPGETLAAAGVHEEVHLTKRRKTAEARGAGRPRRVSRPRAGSLRRTGQRDQCAARRRTRRGLGNFRDRGAPAGFQCFRSAEFCSLLQSHTELSAAHRKRSRPGSGPWRGSRRPCDRGGDRGRGGEVAGDAGAAEAAIAADVTPSGRAQFASLEIRFAAGRTRFAWL